jgi:predicted nucleic acid-binding protein
LRVFIDSNILLRRLHGKPLAKWNSFHGIDPNDAILAATVLLNGGRTITQNASHYSMGNICAQRGL